MPADRLHRGPRHGLTELLLLLAFLGLTALGAAALLGDEARGLLGTRPPTGGPPR